MAIATLVLKVLPAFLCLVDGQTIVCNLKDWTQSSGSAVDDQLVKGSVVALQDQVQQLVGQVKGLQADLLKLQQSSTTSDTGMTRYRTFQKSHRCSHSVEQPNMLTYRRCPRRASIDLSTYM